MSICVAHCVHEARDLLEAFNEVVFQGLVVASWVLSRGLLERLFWMAWCVGAAERSSLFAEAWGAKTRGWIKATLRNRELATRVPPVLQEAGIERTVATRLKEKANKQLPTIERVAEEAGLKNTYDLRYRSESITSHGITLELDPDLITDLHSLGVVGALRTAKAIRTVASNWIEKRVSTPGVEIERVLLAGTRVGCPGA